jgi:hypothetical protein
MQRNILEEINKEILLVTEDRNLLITEGQFDLDEVDDVEEWVKEYLQM